MAEENHVGLRRTSP